MTAEDDIERVEPQVADAETENAAELSGVLEQIDKSRKSSRQSERFWSQILSTKIGRQEIWKLLRDAHTFEARFACGPSGFPDAQATWFHAGEQAWGQRLYLSLTKFDRPNVLLMHVENDPQFAKPKRPKGSEEDE